MSSTENRGPEVRAAASVIYAIALISLLLRCYVRLGITKAFGLDDWSMVMALISFTFNTATCLAGVAHGTGQHVANLDPTDASKAMMFWWYCYLTYCTTMMLSKGSIAAFLVRLTPSNIHRWIIYVALGVTLFAGIAFFFIAMFQCSPVDYFWTRTGNGSCISVDVIIDITYTYSSFSIITDFTFTLLPLWMVWQLNMDSKTKIALIPILSMGIIASCAVCVRLAYVQDFHSADFLWATTDIAIWSQVEQGLAISAGSLATLKPLFRIVMDKFGFTNAGTDVPSSGNVTPAFGSSNKARSNNNSALSSSRTARRNLFSLSTFTRMDDVDELSEDRHGKEVSEIELNYHSDADRNLRSDIESDSYGYKIAGEGFQDSAWPSPTIPLEHGSQEELQGRIAKHTSFDVTTTHRND